MRTVFDEHQPLFDAQCVQCAPASDARDPITYIGQCTVEGSGLSTVFHHRMLDCRGLISPCKQSWLRSTPGHNRRPMGCLLGVERLVQDTTTVQGVVCCVLTD